jgi:hypothetical protein
MAPATSRARTIRQFDNVAPTTPYSPGQLIFQATLTRVKMG